MSEVDERSRYASVTAAARVFALIVLCLVAPSAVLAQRPLRIFISVDLEGIGGRPLRAPGADGPLPTVTSYATDADEAFELLQVGVHGPTGSPGAAVRIAAARLVGTLAPDWVK